MNMYTLDLPRKNVVVLRLSITGSITVMVLRTVLQ